MWNDTQPIRFHRAPKSNFGLTELFIFKEFLNKAKDYRTEGIKNLWEPASLLSLQLGLSYKNDKHLRDTLLKAV